MSRLPLFGVRILDLSRLLPGPFATMVLADLGADVVKVEDPSGGDGLRLAAPGASAGGSAAFQALNRNKRSLALDLRRAEGREAFLRLCQGADAVVESFRPGVLTRWGLGWEVLHGRNPRLVLCSITGHGQTGPRADRAGHDLDYLALSGVLALNGPPEAPVPPAVQLADVAGGAWPAVAGLLAALLGRGAAGEGVHLDISMTEGVLALLAPHLAMAEERGRPLSRGREPLGGGAACYSVYRTRDGRFVALGALEPKFFAAFCEAVGRPELAARQWEGGVGPRAELAELFAARTFADWKVFAEDHDVCLAPLLESDELRGDSQLGARGAFLGAGEGEVGVVSPVRASGWDPPRRRAPHLGEQGGEVLAEAGFAEREIAALRAAGVLGP
ncbi:MAG TPA: CaiB/BaiF CoA-transferase family protein [Anaeromyxobacter sp.]|nr:CaiB/BaiF CoA-transferase family protein [Anaeromyxobacter sp.]